MILNNKYNKCKKCNKICNSIHFQQNFGLWTSGNDDIDKFIQETQLSVHSSNYKVYQKALEWIPYNRFKHIKYIAKGGFGKIYKAKWIDGEISYWDNKNENWERFNPNMEMHILQQKGLISEFF